MVRKEIRSSGVVMQSAILLFFMLLQFEDSMPTTFIVGDEYGWDLVVDMQSWTRGKNFHAGDLLIFNYDYQMWDVVVGNQTGHDSCTVYEGDKVFNFGRDKIRLAFGANYFIDSVPRVCAAGLKMAINATAPPPPSLRRT